MSCFIWRLGGSLTYIFAFDLWNYPQPFSVFLQCINYAQQEPSDSFVFIISASSEPSKSLIRCISQCSSLFWCFIPFNWRRFNNNHLHQSSIYLLIRCFSFPLHKIQTELQAPTSVSGIVSQFIKYVNITFLLGPMWWLSLNSIIYSFLI